MIIKRYNKKVFFPLSEKQALISTIKSLNNTQWKSLSLHARERLRTKFNNDILLIQFIGKLKFDYNSLFEYYVINGKIDKLCFEYIFNGYRLKLVINSNKSLITLWSNNINDVHSTLDKSLYNMA